MIYIVMRAEWYEVNGMPLCAFASHSDAIKYADSKNEVGHEVYWVVSLPITPEG